MTGLGDTLKILLRKLSPPLFSIRIRSGEAILHSGTATPALVREFDQIVRSRKLRSGWVWGISRGGLVVLDFTGDIRDGDRQRFRNVAGVHG